MPLSQVHQHLGSDGSARPKRMVARGLTASCGIPSAGSRRRGSRRTVAAPLRGLSRPMMSQ